MSEDLSTERLAAELAEVKAQLAARSHSAGTVAWQTALDIAEGRHVQVTDPSPELQQAFTASPPTPPQVTPDTTESVTRQALATVAATDPSWSSVSDQVMQKVRENPSRLGELTRSGPMSLAGYLSALAQQERAFQDSRAMKLAAQTMVGASSRPSPMSEAEERWAEIANADTGRLGL